MRRLLLLIVVLVAGCKNHEFLCKSDLDCVGQAGDFGNCLDLHCAFYDPACTTQLRFDDSAGTEANECVPPALLPDAGVGRDGGLIHN